MAFKFEINDRIKIKGIEEKGFVVDREQKIILSEEVNLYRVIFDDVKGRWASEYELQKVEEKKEMKRNFKIGDVVKNIISKSVGKIMAISNDVVSVRFSDGSNSWWFFNEIVLVVPAPSSCGKYFMVHCSSDDNHPTKKRHFDIVSAKNEAERLAKMNPGTVFSVLEVVETASVTPMKVEWKTVR